LSEKEKPLIDPQGIRNAHVSLAVMAPIMLIGGFLLRHADTAVFQAFGVSTFFFGIGLLLVLEIRRERREERQDAQAEEADQ
jgi:asparagine N-glycosylation enzyme membrane subunit Stt3